MDDHLVEPEITRDEIVGGRRIVASPAETPHADQQVQLDYVLRAHVAPGYRAATDLITRFGVDSDFASDTCVRREGIDPATGRRYLEEIAFEIVSEQREKLATEKAERMHHRGVRRVFALWIKRGEVAEWSPEEKTWRRLEAEAKIEDPCLAVPVAVAALLGAGLADDAVAAALAAKGNPVLRELEVSVKKAAQRAGQAEGVARSVLEVLAARGVETSAGQRMRIQGCQDIEQLGRWLRRASVATVASEVLEEL